MSGLLDRAENGVYRSVDDNGKVRCLIEKVGENTYKAKNMDVNMTAEIVPINKNTVKMRCIEHKRRGKDGKYRKTTKLLENNLNWLWYMLEETGLLVMPK